MPNRIIREGFLDSEAVNSLNEASEVFYHRLMLAVDDAGRIDGRSEMLKSRLFPLKDRLRASDIDTRLHDCIKQGLLMRYQWLNKPFIQLMKWQRCSPCTVSKYPWKDGSHRIEYVKLDTRDGVKDFVKTSIPEPNVIPSASLTDGIEGLPCQCTDTDTKTDTKTKTETLTCSELENRFEAFWEKYPRKTAKQEAQKAFLKVKPDEQLFNRMLNAVELHKLTRDWKKDNGQFIPYPATWLNQKRWEDDHSNALKPDDFSQWGKTL